MKREIEGKEIDRYIHVDRQIADRQIDTRRKIDRLIDL